MLFLVLERAKYKRDNSVYCSISDEGLDEKDVFEYSHMNIRV